MDKEIKKEAWKQFLHYFRFWFLALFIVFAVWLVMLIMSSMVPRGNSLAPKERVYDIAEVLTDEEEQRLREYIAKCEEKYEMHIVLVTINEDIEGTSVSYQGREWPAGVTMAEGALTTHDWERIMREYADNFYDQKNFGYDKVHGDGVLILDNWYEDEYGSQKGTWLSTCGRVYDSFSMTRIDRVLDAIYYGMDKGAYAAYKEGIDNVCWQYQPAEKDAVSVAVPLIVPVIVALIYLFSHLSQPKAQDTTSPSTYVSGGKPVMKVKRDDFIRKHVVTRHIDTSSSGGGSSRGGGGGHVSSGGVSHGGGGRRR